MTPSRVVAHSVDDEGVGGQREHHQRRGEQEEEWLAHCMQDVLFSLAQWLVAT